MTTPEMITRTKQFALRILHLVDNLPNTHQGYAIARQLVRCGTSPGANYRAACIAKSQNDFVNKLKMVEEELDETVYRIELIIEGNILPESRVRPLYEEAKELCKIIVTSIKTAKENNLYKKTLTSSIGMM